jgi:hypothetical protein
LSGSSVTGVTTGSVTITFSSPFSSVPKVNATITGANFGLIRLDTITVSGFTVFTASITPTIVAAGYPFNWQASP